MDVDFFAFNTGDTLPRLREVGKFFSFLSSPVSNYSAPTFPAAAVVPIGRPMRRGSGMWGLSFVFIKLPKKSMAGIYFLLSQLNHPFDIINFYSSSSPCGVAATIELILFS